VCVCVGEEERGHKVKVLFSLGVCQQAKKLTRAHDDDDGDDDDDDDDDDCL